MWCAHALSANFYFALVCHEFILFVVSRLKFQQVPTFQKGLSRRKKKFLFSCLIHKTANII